MFSGVFLLIYLCAPVFYIGIMQAALLDKLGTSAAIANLPASTYQLAQLAPLFVAWLVPHSKEQYAAMWASIVTAVLTGLVALTLVIPCPAEVRVWTVIAHGLTQGVTGSIVLIFLIQCLKRGTSPEGQARALQFAYSVGPLMAVAGSLSTQYLLNVKIDWLPFPYAFAGLYAFAAPCALAAAWMASQFRLQPIPEDPPQPLGAYLATAARTFVKNRPLMMLFFAFLLWNCTLGAMSNLTLFTREAVGREPKDLAGWMMAIRFGCKAVGGYFLGWLAVRRGLRVAVLGVMVLDLAGMIWPWVVPGYAFLFAFGLLGAGELGGGFIPNYGSRLVPAAIGATMIAMLNLAAPLAGFAPSIHGYVADHMGFNWSFAFGIATTIGAGLLVWMIRPEDEAAQSGK